MWGRLSKGEMSPATIQAVERAAVHVRAAARLVYVGLVIVAAAILFAASRREEVARGR